MKLLREFISLLLIESRISDVQAKYPELDIEALVALDPTNNNKYLVWIAKQVSLGNEPEQIGDAVSKFHMNIQRLQKKDINAYKDLADLEAALQIVSEPSKTQKKKLAKSGVEVIYNDEEVTVKHIDTKAAAVQYGRGTKWCISMAKSTHYEEYDDKGVLFYYIFANEPKGDDNDKIAVAAYNIRAFDTEIFNAADQCILDLPEEYDSAAIMSAIESHFWSKDPKFIINYATVYKVLDNHNSTPDDILEMINYIPKLNDDFDYLLPMAAENPNTPPEAFYKMFEMDKLGDTWVSWLQNSNLPNDLRIKIQDFKEGTEDLNKNPNLTVEQLDHYAQSDLMPIKILVADHKNTSESTLSNLAHDNSRWVQEAVASNPHTLPNTLEFLATSASPQVRSYVAGNPNTPTSALRHLINDEFSWIRGFAQEQLDERS